MKNFRYKIISYGGPEDEDIAEVWWDTESKSIQCDNKMYSSSLRKLRANGYKYEDGLDFMQNLPYAYRNGYMVCKRLDDVE